MVCTDTDSKKGVKKNVFLRIKKQMKSYSGKGMH